MKVRVPVNASIARFFLGPAGRALLVGCALFTCLSFGGFTFFYAKYSRLIEQRLQEGPFANTAKIYAAPESVAVGDTSSPADVAAALRRSGYNESRSNPIGSYQIQANSIEVFPGPESYFDQEAGVVRFRDGKISQIVSLQDNTQRNQYQLEPPLITNVSGPNREKRRMVRFRDIPTLLVEAVTSAEDKRFFQHAGFDPFRIIKAAYVDLREGRKDQGASTLSMQLARNFFLDPGKRWSRKLAEIIITLQLEQKLSKQDIFEDYANQIYLGWRGSFRIHGFGEAAEVYLGKDLSQVNLPEAAELAGLIQRPAYFDPFHHPDRLKERRNVVLGLMRQNGYINDREYAQAIEAPLTVARGAAQSVDAPYFIDMVNDSLQTKFQDEDFTANAYRVYTTLDMRLQKAASEAIRAGMAGVDDLVKKQRRFKGQTAPEAQVALIAIDPHTGEVKALSGGRNYGLSQLNRVLAKRQPGSIFKPFVYSAALDTAVEGSSRVLTPSSMVDDEPTTFWFDGKPYEPKNFDGKFFGEITFREALAHSRNIAAVKVAQMVGYDAVVQMAARGGFTGMHSTPSVALGSYDVTPLEAVGAYTMFANQGQYVKPTFLRLVRDNNGKNLYKNKSERKAVLDPRVAYLMTNMMEEVLRSGTAAGVRGKYGFRVPAAGKTGTSRDGWFAGYTTELLCVVWVGFDDGTDLELEGAHSAAPIWADFMNRALQYREYRNARPFNAPDGVIVTDIDPASGMLAMPGCPTHRSEVYISGTQPVGSCPLHGGGRTGITTVAGWDTAPPPASQSSQPPSQQSAPSQQMDRSLRVTGSSGDGYAPLPTVARRTQGQDHPGAAAQNPQGGDPQKKDQEKKGIFRRLIGVFK